jgi:hypothetical protein
MKALLFLAALIIPLAGIADDPPATNPSLPIVKHENLDSARAKLLKAGWTPKVFHGASDEISEQQQEFMDAGYKETERCSQDGPYCNLDYTNAAGQCLILTSKGEDPKTAIVGGWRFGCGSA